MIQKTELIMGMPITVAVVDLVPSAIIDKVLELFTSVDGRFSTYKKDSEISRLNRGEVSPAAYSKDMKTVLDLADAARRQTDGYFNVYHNGYIDPSGIVKSWAIAKAARLILRAGADNFYIEAGGDIMATGKNPHHQPWTVGIRHPKQPNKIVKTLRLSDMAIATSGTYERGNHIYNPHTGLPATELLSLTVVGPSIEAADILATAAFAMGLQGLDFIERQAGYEGLAITPVMRGVTTEGFNAYVAH